MTKFLGTEFLDFFDHQKEFEHSGMIDWLTLKICLTMLPDWFVHQLQALSSKLFKVNALSGEVDWETYCWETVRSDTHQVCFKVGSEFCIQGSPARIGLPNNVFGSADIRYCANKMIKFAEHHFSEIYLSESLPENLQIHPISRVITFPDIKYWSCTRIDVTRNYLMQSEAEVRQALSYLKQTPESRQRHSYESFGFYIGKGSTLKRGKIYLKGQDAKRNKRSGRAEYTDDEIKKSMRLLRAEMTLARHELRRMKDEKNFNWYDLDTDYLLKLHDDYFSDYFSDIEISDMSNTSVSPFFCTIHFKALNWLYFSIDYGGIEGSNWVQ